LETFVIIAYCASDDAVKKLGLVDDIQTGVGMAQIVTTVIVAARFFGGNHRLANEFLHEHRYFYNKLSKSQFNRRLHDIPYALFNELMEQFSEYSKMTNESFEFAMDSFPIPSCDNIRISRSKLFAPKQHRGYIASKKRYFNGLRVHLIATLTRQIVEFKIFPGATSDVKGAKSLEFNLPAGSVVYADKGCSSYKHEDELRETKLIELAAIRKKNSRRPRTANEEALVRRKRKPIETTISLLTRLFPKNIHAVTQKGFILKVVCFVLAYCTEGLLQVTT